MKAKTISYLYSEPFADSDTLIKVPLDAEFTEETTCFIGTDSLNYSRVTYEGITGYIDLLDTEYVELIAEEWSGLARGGTGTGMKHFGDIQ